MFQDLRSNKIAEKIVEILLEDLEETTKYHVCEIDSYTDLEKQLKNAWTVIVEDILKKEVYGSDVNG